MDLEGIFHEQLRQIAVSPDDITAYLENANEGIKAQQERLQSLMSERQRLGQMMDRVFDLHVAGQISHEGFGSRYKPLEHQVKQLDEEIPRLQAEIDYVKITYLSRDQVLNSAQTLFEKWKDLPSEEKRTIAEAVVERVTVGTGEVSIEMCCLPSSLPSERDKMGSKPFNLAPAKSARFASSTAMYGRPFFLK